LNVDFAVVFLSEIVDVETAVLLSAGSLLLKTGGWKRRKVWSSFGNVQGSGMLVKVLGNHKLKFYKLFAG